MSRPRVLITGPGYCGSTYLVNLAGACGLYLGEKEDMHSIDERHGQEWRPFLQAVRRLRSDSRLHDSVQMHGSALIQSWHSGYMPQIDVAKRGAVRADYHDELLALNYPDVVKLPIVIATAEVVLPTLRPDLLVLAHRPFDEWLHAVRTENPEARNVPSERLWLDAAAGLGRAVATAVECDIPYSVVWYPKVAEDIDYAWEAYGKPLGVSAGMFYAAHRKVTRPDFIRASLRPVAV